MAQEKGGKVRGYFTTIREHIRFGSMWIPLQIGSKYKENKENYEKIIISIQFVFND